MVLLFGVYADQFGPDAFGHAEHGGDEPHIDLSDQFASGVERVAYGRYRRDG